jgi:predicted O-methyltransferase YrrM
MEDVFSSDKRYYPFEALELVRSKLKTNHSIISVTDLGAGSKKLKTNQRAISTIAKTSLKRKKYCEIVFRLANKTGANTILELGTSLGITTGYLGKARRNARIYTLEGCPEIAKIAKENFKLLMLPQIETIIGNFDDTLADVLLKETSFDFIFIDGNHQKEATLRYFNQVLPYINEHSVIIFDDIHWSPYMESAWNTIIQNELLTVTIDLFEMGIVFFRKEQKKQHFVLKV